MTDRDLERFATAIRAHLADRCFIADFPIMAAHALDIDALAKPPIPSDATDDQVVEVWARVADAIERSLRLTGTTLEQRRMIETILSGEPVFLLRAQDELAGDVVRIWALRAEDIGVSRCKVNCARDRSTEMDDWPTKKLPD